MKQSLRLTAISASFFLVFAVLFLSCVPQKKINYLQQQQERDTVTTHTRNQNPVYKVQPGDNLYIRVFTLDEKALLFFNKQSGVNTYNDYANDASIYLNSYSVSADGTIDFPIIGKVYVRELTVDQIKILIQDKVNEYLKETVVVVKMVNFRITLVGEIMKPGEFTIYKDEINIFEALSLAGDMTEYANRNRVALIRKSKEGSKVHYLDMTSDKILASDYYYLQPNDIIYVAPLGYKRWGLGSTFPWAIVLASLTTTLLLINYFKN